jgi:DNA repair photolyase
MSSSTDPYLPQEYSLRLTQMLLEEMLDRPPDVLVIQTHAWLIRRDVELIQALSRRCELWVSITVETDIERIPGFPPHASSPGKRIALLKVFRDAGVKTQATISPLLPIVEPEIFAQRLDEACSRVIVDHYLLGDGSPNGLRTKRTNFIQLLEQSGYGEWTTLEKFEQIRDVLVSRLGLARVLVSREGFNAVGGV